jgi:hypothetical protein
MGLPPDIIAARPFACPYMAWVHRHGQVRKKKERISNSDLDCPSRQFGEVIVCFSFWACANRRVLFSQNFHFLTGLRNGLPLFWLGQPLPSPSRHQDTAGFDAQPQDTTEQACRRGDHLLVFGERRRAWGAPCCLHILGLRKSHGPPAPHSPSRYRPFPLHCYWFASAYPWDTSSSLTLLAVRVPSLLLVVEARASLEIGEGRRQRREREVEGNTQARPFLYPFMP